MPFFSFLDDKSGMRDIIMNLPDRMGPFNQLAEVLLRGDSAFTEAERELIGAFVSATNNCSYCYGSHASTAAEYGVDKNIFESLLDDIDTAPVDEKLKPVLRYVRKLTRTSDKMIQADADAVFDAGWDESALSDAILICGLFNMANRVVDGHGVNKNIPEEVFQQSAKILATQGYLPPE